MSRLKSRATMIAMLLTAVLVPALAILQYQWLGSLSELERSRMRANLHWATERFCGELDRDLTRIYSTFQSHLGGHAEAAEQLAAAYAEWSSTATHPALVKDVRWISREGGQNLRIQRFDPHRQRLEDSDWPPELAAVEDDVSAYVQEWSNFRRGGDHGSYGGSDDERNRSPELLGERTDPLLADVPALLVWGEGTGRGCAAVTLDRDVLFNQIIPERIREDFVTGGDLDYDIIIVDASDPGRVVYRSAPGISPEDLAEPDEDHGLFALRLRRQHSDAGRWQFLVKHRAGSLEAAVTTTRHRNLAVSFGALLLLGATVVMLIVTTRRAHALARRQVEFVGGVSHELRTPLAGISSLSENLADGLVQDIDKARAYGQAIHRETRRLGDMLERVLLFSRLESANPYETRGLDVVEVIESAVASTRSWIVERGVTVEKEIQKNLPLVLGDPRVLKIAIQNVLVNAVKFSPPDATIRIRANMAARNDAKRMHIAVEDHGFGIPASELSHIFEPFYRGSNAREKQIEGSGLGLSIVKRILEAQGGRVTVKSELGKGTTTTLHLPVAEHTAPPGQCREDDEPPAS